VKTPFVHEEFLQINQEDIPSYSGPWMLVKWHNRRKQLSGASQPKLQEKKSREDTKGKTDVNARKIINFDEVIKDKDSRSGGSCVALKIPPYEGSKSKLSGFKENDSLKAFEVSPNSKTRV